MRGVSLNCGGVSWPTDLEVEADGEARHLGEAVAIVLRLCDAR